MPKDPVMLLSFVNTQLRDNYENLDELCGSMDTNKSDVISALAEIDYYYDSALNKFI